MRKRIVGWSKEQLVALATRVEDTYPSEPLQLLIEEFTPTQTLRVSPITRQHLLRDLVGLGPLEGKLDLLEFLGRLWKLDSAAPTSTDFRCGTVKDLIFQHMIRNNDYSYSEMLDLLGVPGMSHKRFVEFLEWTVHPLARVDVEQERYVESINGHLRQDGLALVASETVSGFPVFRVAQIVGGVSGSAKNLIFASTGPKPEIVFSDAVNNDIQVVRNAEYCLIYDQAFSKNGLLWKHLISWWTAKTGCFGGGDRRGFDPAAIPIRCSSIDFGCPGNTNPGTPPLACCSIIVQDRAEAAVLGEQRIAAEPARHAGLDRQPDSRNSKRSSSLVEAWFFLMTVNVSKLRAPRL